MITAAGRLPEEEAALLADLGLCERGLTLMTDEPAGKTLVYFRAVLIRSDRTTISLQIKPDGKIVLRAPRRVPERELREFMESRTDWMGKHLLETARRMARREEEAVPDQAELQRKKKEFSAVLAEKTAYYAARMGIQYNRITIRSQKTRWGSCSSAGNLNFNIRLADVPEELLDYVIVHELAHRREMNHSTDFWKIVEREIPDWRDRRKRLKEYSL
ncbi:MAG: M48 family metallopeptidase [Clostridium sp.]|nr:M48 family metallopeptidase [Clostridium sp.]